MASVRPSRVTKGPANEAEPTSAPVDRVHQRGLGARRPDIDAEQDRGQDGNNIPLWCGARLRELRPSPPHRADVRDCYARSSERGAAEARGRRQLKSDGANEVTANFLRATMPASETALWRRLQPTFEGFRFVAQVLMLGYSLDFYCHRLALAIEVDGGSHRGRDRADQLREDDLRANHVDVVRVPAELVLDDIEQALDSIRIAVGERAGQLERRAGSRCSRPISRVCRHQNDSLLCEQCKIVDREMAERQAQREVGEEPPPKLRIPLRPQPLQPGAGPGEPPAGASRHHQQPRILTGTNPLDAAARTGRPLTSRCRAPRIGEPRLMPWRTTRRGSRSGLRSSAKKRWTIPASGGNWLVP